MTTRYRIVEYCNRNGLTPDARNLVIVLHDEGPLTMRKAMSAAGMTPTEMRVAIRSAAAILIQDGSRLDVNLTSRKAIAATPVGFYE